LSARNVRESLKVDPDRLGHCVSVGEDNYPIGLLNMMKQKEIHVECCLTSNEKILGITNGHHPLPLFISKGIPFSICTDDEGVNVSSLSKEFEIAATRYGTKKHSADSTLSYKVLKKSSQHSIKNSFLPGDSIYKNASLVLIDLFVGFRDSLSELTKEQKMYLEKSDKAKMEVRLERKFKDFEEEFTPKFMKEWKIAVPK